MKRQRDLLDSAGRCAGWLLGAALLAAAAAGCERSEPAICRSHADCRVCQRCVNGGCRDDLALANCTPPRCEGCLAARGSCGEVCRDGGYAAGFCGAPASTDPAVCCACDETACDVPPDGVFDRGKLLERSEAYDYSPVMVLDRDHRLRLWWCSRGASGADAVFYAWSNDWTTWSEPVEALAGFGPPHQGKIAGSPEVVQAADGRFLMFFTSQDAARSPDVHYQIFLARSADGIAWEPVNDGRPVIPLLDAGDDLGRPSAVVREGRILLFHNRKVGESSQVLAAESTDQGESFTLRDGGRPVLSGVGSCSFAYLPAQERYLGVCQAESALERLRFYLLAADLSVIAELEPSSERWLQPCNHSPALLRDTHGMALEEHIVPVVFGAGPRAGDICWNPGGWDLHAADLYLEALLDAGCR